MSDYQVQFSVDDVIRVVKDWKEKHTKNDYFTGFLDHEIKSPFGGLVNMGSLTINHKYKEEKILSDLVQRAYASNVLSLGMLIVQNLQQIVSIIEGEPFIDINQVSSRLHSRLTQLTEYSPITPVVTRLGAVKDEQKEYCEKADNSIRMILYMANRLFSPSCQNSHHYLEEGVNAFYINADSTFTSEGVALRVGKVSYFITLDDYVANSIQPLAWNAMQHAFNPENDVKNKLKQPDYKKAIFIFGVPETQERFMLCPGTESTRPTATGNYIITVCDNGFGIPEDVLPHIFKKGFSTKPEPGHGIGLWGVKAFAEKYGGKVTVETKLGEGTIFRVSVPYKSTHDDYWCIQ